MGKVKPIKSEPGVNSQSILLDDFALAANAPRCTPTTHPSGLSSVDPVANDAQNIPVISVTSISHPLETVCSETRKTQAIETKRLPPMAKSESVSTSISCEVRPCSGSTPSSVGSEVICRICHSEAEPDQPLISPCLCSGTLKFVHQECLHHWIKSSDLRYCELCKFEYMMKITTKPFSKWQNLEMSPVERRKIVCSVTFHVIALTCVIWSLYVLIERTTEEVSNGVLEWPFWTKLIVMAIGFVGGVVFMYVQCRMYVGLCRRWRAHNRTFVVRSVPQDVLYEARLTAKHRPKATVTTAEPAPARPPETAAGDVSLAAVRATPVAVAIETHTVDLSAAASPASSPEAGLSVWVPARQTCPSVV